MHAGYHAQQYTPPLNILAAPVLEPSLLPQVSGGPTRWWMDSCVPLLQDCTVMAKLEERRHGGEGPAKQKDWLGKEDRDGHVHVSGRNSKSLPCPEDRDWWKVEA